MAFPMFKRSKVTLPVPAPKPDDLHEMVEVLAHRGLAGAIEHALQKQVDSLQNFQAYEAVDDQGNYFGQEFNIRATAGRIKGTYTREPWIFATATLIARTLASVPFQVVNSVTGDVDEQHPLNKKLAMGNRNEDAYTANWKGYLDLVLGGNYFRAFNAAYSECMQVPVELASLIIAQDGRTVEYLQIADAKGTTTTIPYKQCIHHKYPNPFNPYYGLSLFIAASRPIILDRFKNEFEMAFYLRGATNSGVIETTEDINKSRMDRLMRTFEAVYTGKRNWWRTIFLPKGAKWVQSGLTMSEMQHLEGLRENRLTILAVLGIPPSQLGIVADVNRATAEQQERAFWTNTIKPLAEFVAAGWNNSHLVKVIYGGSVKVVPDFSDVQALQGSLLTKGEQAKSVENYLWIDEIREDILGYPALPNGAGQKFVAEVRGAGVPSPLGLSAPASAPAPADPIAEVVTSTENAAVELAQWKAQAVTSQERIEKKLGEDYLAVYQKYIDRLLSVAEHALRDGTSVQARLSGASVDLAKKYGTEVAPVMQAALDRGFSFATAQAKMLSNIGKKKLRFSAYDQQAIDALREEQRDGQRETLLKRAIDSFVGFNQTRSNEILDLIAEGIEGGKNTEQIAAAIRSEYAQAYKEQAFTIARTELLTAVSQGIKWNHDVLGQVFTKVMKQWFHVGDVGTNPDARENHYHFEGMGPQKSDYKWGGILEFPRDPSAPASETINCRCSMSSVIPDDADSNAEIILDRI